MGNSPITSTLVVGRHTLLREGLAALLQHSNFKIRASAGRASDLKDIRAADRQPVAILTTDDAAGSLAEAADNICILRTRFNCRTIVIVAATRNPVDIRQITSLGPNAYIANLTSRELLLKVLDLPAFTQPVLVLSSGATTATLSEPMARPEQLERLNGNGHEPSSALSDGRDGEGPRFSQRERQILCQLARGGSNKEIARVFCITESTVKVHLKALLRKIGARNRTQAAIWAVGRDYLVTSPLAQPSSKQRVEHSPHADAIDLPSAPALANLGACFRA